MAGPRNSISRRLFLRGAASAAAVFTLSDWLDSQALAQTVRVRPALESQAGQRMLGLYARGVGIMRNTRPAHDPLSWTFQANIHDYPENTNAETVFRGRRTDPAIQRRYELAMGGGGRPGIWRTCSHFHNENPANIHFLSWHRMYVYFFERAVERLVGEPFAMPYWNYTLPTQRRLPAAFRDARVGGRPNPLFFAARNRDFNRDGLPADAVRTSTAFAETRLHHTRRGFNRQLEERPHNMVHGAIGTPQGMGATPMAARDPLFWVHHTAVDRFWETWRLARPDGTSDRDPTAPPSWLAKQFAFADPDGNRVEMSVADVLRASSRLNYRYDTLEPLPATGGLAFAADRSSEAAPTQLSASKGGAVLTRKNQKATLEVQPSAPSSVALGFSQNPASYFDLVVDVEVNAPPGALYEVYVTVPRTAGATETEEVKVDTFSLFGVEHGGGGGHQGHAAGPLKTQWRADITGLVGQGRIDPQKPGKVSVRVIYADPASEVRITGVGIEAE